MKNLTKQDIVDAVIVMDGIDVQGTGGMPSDDCGRLADAAYNLLHRLAMREEFDDSWVEFINSQWDAWKDCYVFDGDIIRQVAVVHACELSEQQLGFTDTDSLYESVSYTPIVA